MIGDRVAAAGFDFLGHVVSGRGGFLLPRDRDSEIVDHDCASLCGECPRDTAADAAAAAGDCGYLTVELAHRLKSPLLQNGGIQTPPVSSPAGVLVPRDRPLIA